MNTIFLSFLTIWALLDAPIATNKVYLISDISTTSLTVNINDIDEGGKGEIYVLLWKDSDGFPRSIEKSTYQGVISDFQKTGTYTFNNVPKGKYAISIFQDQNSNKELDTNFVGIPKEPIGAYNMKGLGRPSFKKSIFELNESVHTMSIKMLND